MVFFPTYTQVDFLKEKSDTFDAFTKLCVKLKNEKDCMTGKIMTIRSDHGREFENTIYVEFYDNYGISHEFSAPKTPRKMGLLKKEQDFAENGKGDPKQQEIANEVVN